MYDWTASLISQIILFHYSHAKKQESKLGLRHCSLLLNNAFILSCVKREVSKQRASPLCTVSDAERTALRDRSLL